MLCLRRTSFVAFTNTCDHWVRGQWGGRGSPFNDVCHQAIFAEEYENGENCHTIDVCAYTYLKYDIRPSLGRNVYYFHTRIDGYLLYYIRKKVNGNMLMFTSLAKVSISQTYTARVIQYFSTVYNNIRVIL